VTSPGALRCIAAVMPHADYLALWTKPSITPSMLSLPGSTLLAGLQSLDDGADMRRTQ
jgi:hypothetical protein